MGRLVHRTLNFFSDLFMRQEVPCVYSGIQLRNSDILVYKCNGDRISLSAKGNPYSTALIPEYLELNLADEGWEILNSANQFNLGYAIRFEEGFCIDTHLKNNFKSNYRNVKKKHQRLEACFPIRYQVLHGPISKDEYEMLMGCLRTMLESRFRQRQDRNEILNEWDDLLSRTYQQIIDKKASLFVIYDNDVPIDISLNYHLNKIMYGAISSYDIDYYKFGLGTIEKIKILEWCLDNDYKILDFGYGDLEYKQNWSNYSYPFRHHVIYKRNSYLSKQLARYELLRLSVKEYLKSKKINVFVNNIRTLKLFSRNKKAASNHDLEYTGTVLKERMDDAILKEIHPDVNNRFPLKLALNNFLYATQEQKVETTVHEILDDSDSYLICGKNNIQKIIFGGNHPEAGPPELDASA